MTAMRMAQTAYGQNAQTIKTPRGTEYEAFAWVTQRIKASHAKGRAGFADLAAALHDNRRLWSILASDVADEGNALPRDLRARIVYLAEYTQIHSQAVLSQGASPTSLVDINTAIMSGLRDQGPVT